MKALTFADVRQVEYATVPDPVIRGDDETIVRVHHAGICGSDLHIYHGREAGLDAGTVMGHEFVGQIVDIGKAVTNFRIGDQVCSPFTVNCGACFHCRRGLTARCSEGKGFFGWVQDGCGLHGAQAEYVRVPFADSTLVKVPAGMLPEEALLLGDNLSTGFFCADMAQVEPGGTYAVVGCGVVGLMSVLAASEMAGSQPTNIIAIDQLPYRLALAKEMGATMTATPEEAEALIKDATDGRGADSVLEAVGNPQAQVLALRLLRHGGILAVVGMHTAPQFAFSPADAYNHNLTYKTGRCPARHYMGKLLPVVEQYRPKLQRLITHRMPLHEGVNGYHLFDEKKENCLKVLLRVSDTG